MDFDQIYQLYFKDVYLYLRSICANEDIAEEMTQEAFAKALKALHTFDGSKDVRAWLFTIARNTYYSYYRKQKHYTKEALEEDLADSSVSFTQKIMDEESAFQIHCFLHQMKEPYKEVFTLRIFGELSFERIGQLFGKSDVWARVTFYRGKKQIIEYMEEMEREKGQL